MEHSNYMHLVMARGRIEVGLPPAALRTKRPWYIRWREGLSVMAGRSVGVLTHPHYNEGGSDGTLRKHRLFPRANRTSEGV